MQSKLALFSMVSFLAVSLVHAKSLVQPVQSDIFYEIEHGNKKSIKTWLKSKPDLSIKNAQGQSVLHGAVVTGNYKLVVAILRSKIDLNLLDNQGKTALDYAVEHKFDKIVAKLARYKAQVTTPEAAEYVLNITKSKKAFKIVAITVGTILGLCVMAYAGFVVACMLTFRMAG